MTADLGFDGQSCSSTQPDWNTDNKIAPAWNLYVAGRYVKDNADFQHRITTRPDAMPYANFSMFGSALCEVAGVPYPKLEPELNGLLAFHLMLRDVAVNLVHLVAPENDEAHMLVMFGVAPPDQELEILRTLGDANFAMMASASPVLCRQPDTGEIVLRKSVSLSLVEAGDAFKAIVQLAELARQWRVNPMLAQLDASSTLVGPQQMI